MADMQTVIELASVQSTDAGMLALWDPQAFAGVMDFGSWESELVEDEDVLRHVLAGALVPINIRSDGAFGILVRVGGSGAPAELTERESACRLVSSQPYRFASGGRACVSGIEDVCAEPDGDSLQVPVLQGEHVVTVHLIEWDAEPGARDGDGSPAAGALPDFVVLVNPLAVFDGSFRVAVETFERPDQ